MPLFTFSAARDTGTVIRGERDAENQKILAHILKQEGLFLLDAKEKNAAGATNFFRIDFNDIVARFFPVSAVDKMFFARNLGVMIAAGLPLTRALEATAEETTNKKFSDVITDIEQSIISGKSFAESMHPHEKIFGILFIHMVEVGEVTGKLTLILKLIANQMKKDYDIKKRVRGAMIYPAIIIVALFAIATFMMVYVVPTLAQTIKDLGAEIPASTKFIIFISELLTNYGLWVFAGVLGIAFLFWKAIRTEKGKALFDRMVLRVPIFGVLIKKYNAARFSRTLAYLITSGISFVRSLEITSNVLGNTLFKKAVQEASVEIQKGKQLNAILAAHTNIFQPMVIHMIRVGEETGKISDMLLRLALFFEEDVTNTTKNMASVVEPVLMILVGAAIGFFAISMFQPIYSTLGNIG